VAYLQYWVGQLKADKKLIVQAASHAQKAANLILGIIPDPIPAPPAPGKEVQLLTTEEEATTALAA
jgi:antirestriction protein ArdC